MRRNDGIIATGGSNVVGNAVASGRNSKAEVRDSGLTQYGDGQQPSPQDLDALLSRLIDELGQSDHPERDDLIEAAEDAREEASAEAPRKGKLKVFARALVGAVPGFTALTTLAVAIEQAIHGL